MKKKTSIFFTFFLFFSTLNVSKLQAVQGDRNVVGQCLVVTVAIGMVLGPPFVGLISCLMSSQESQEKEKKNTKPDPWSADWSADWINSSQ